MFVFDIQKDPVEEIQEDIVDVKKKPRTAADAKSQAA